MNVGITRRGDRRFRAYVPLRIYGQGGVQTLVPRDISISSCYFDFENQTFVSDGLYNLEIAFAGDAETIKITDARVFRRDSLPGFGFKWQLAPADSARLFSFLLRQSNEPSTHSKVLYIVNEQKCLFQAFRDIADQKQKGYKFLFGLIAAYFIYLAAPLHFFEIKSVEQATFYALGGVWASLILLFHCFRFLNWLGISVRRKAFLVHAMAGNRAWVFVNDGSYYSKSIFPMGARYDDARVWGQQKEPTKHELFPLAINYRGSTTIFHLFVQAIFAAGLILFLSIIIRVIVEKGESVVGGFRLFDSHFFALGYSGFCIFLLLWIQNCTNGCAQYQRRVWEARRISASRPNPRFTGKGLKREQPELYKISHILMYFVWFYGAAVMVAMFAVHYLPAWLYLHLEHWIGPTIVLALFFGSKLLYINMTMKAESNMNETNQRLIQPQARVASA